MLPPSKTETIQSAQGEEKHYNSIRKYDKKENNIN